MAKNKKKVKTYQITTIEDITKMITLENAENFIKDFKGFIASILLVKAIAKEKKISYKNNFAMRTFEWIDDGKHNIVTELQPTDEEK